MKIHVQPTKEKYAAQAKVMEKLVNQREVIQRIERESEKALIKALLGPRQVGLGYFRVRKRIIPKP